MLFIAPITEKHGCRVHSQLVYHTENAGATWKQFDKVEKTGNLRFIAVHFAPDGKTGLFGATSNVLYKTADNCTTWQKLPTPLSQNKYKNVAESNRADIHKVRIFGNYFIVKQQSKVFISCSDSIDWKYLPDVYDFECSESGKLYVVNKNLSINLYSPPGL
ncbi:MAG: hypothetical protein JWQ25_190 [Daejeonella sp.]|nr:hypothetical protein [Daejeonella sp.]